MTSPTDLPTLDQPEFADSAVAMVQSFMTHEMGVEMKALEASTLLELLRPHIVQSLVAELATVAPTPYVVRLDALTLAVQRAAGCPGCSPLDPEHDVALELAPIFETYLAECIDAGTAPEHLRGEQLDDDQAETEATRRGLPEGHPVA